MKKKFSIEAKVGLFVLIAILLLAYITIDVSKLGIVGTGTYKIYAIMENAEGVTMKTPVQVAGITVGVVRSIELTPEQKAKVEFEIRDDVKLGKNVQAEIKSRGVLGDTYIELIPGATEAGQFPEGGAIQRVKQPADYQELIRDVSQLVDDLKEITSAIKTYTVSDQSSTAQILKNMEVMTANLAKFSTVNMANMDAIVSNLRALTADLRSLAKDSSPDIELALKRIAEITDKVDSGEGTLGKLINDSETVDRTNKILKNVEGITRGFSRFQTELGWHIEYLGTTKDVKNYVSLTLQPRPDKYFLFEVVHDPNPTGSTSTETNTVTANGVTSVITTETEKFNEVRFTAEIAKKFNDFTIHGGLIESTGGVGVNYNKGPVGLQFSAFDFTADRPHLKFLTQLNVFPAFYLLGGLDDFISSQHGLDWFVGAGIRLTDRDIQSLFGAASLAR